ncbi:MAG: hypothetical protein ONB23_09040 [candidate division KSB1 bacterium]|nr:hypothetical protein [candidate division KSB1 bacterium]
MGNPQMYGPGWQVRRILVETEARDLPVARRILAAFPQAEVVETDRLSRMRWEESPPADLAVARHRGRFLKRCPGTRTYLCCGYYVLNVQVGCPLACTYCALQGYWNAPAITVYANLECAIDQLENELKRHPRRFYRIGTGELSDSLFLDATTGISQELVRFFARAPNAVLELKTKLSDVDHLLDLEPRGRVILSWSLNADPVARAEEKGAPSVEERLLAARKAEEAGFRLGFHFDPLVHHAGWSESYRQVVEALFSYVRPSSIVWISLGALRYPPSVDRILRERHPFSRLRLAEMVRGLDGKLRYPRPLRTAMFRCVAEWIRRAASGVFIYLCMESEVVWRESLGWSPGSRRKLSELLDERARLGME